MRAILTFLIALVFSSNLFANSLNEILKEIFPKSSNIFGVEIIATEKVKDKDISKAAKILEQWLDNNNDGKIDNHLVLESIIKNNAKIIMASSERNLDDSFDELIEMAEGLNIDPNSFEPQLIGLIAHEPNIAYLEEILHMITQWGYAFAYPDVFGEENGTELATAMDDARGGHFEDVPDRYPVNSWYHYDDDECDYSCMITEYIYWSITSLLGAQKNRLEDIEDEWEFNTPTKMQKDKKFIIIYNNSEYNLPTKLPKF